MNIHDAIIIGVSAILFISVVIFMILPASITYEEREGARPRDGITVVHSNHIHVESMAFYFVNTLDPNLIEVRFFTFPNDNNPKSGIVGIYFPYKVELDREYNVKNTDFTSWYKEDYGHGTIFVKSYTCNDEINCNLVEDNQVRFILQPDLKFDSQNVYRHSIKVKFDNPGGKGLDIFGEFEDSRNLEYGFSTTKSQATIIIDEKVDNIHTLPIPEPGIFHNSYNDYSNTQLDWTIMKNEHAFFVDFQMPDERKNYETNQNDITAAGIIIGLFSIAVSIFGIFGRRKERALDHSCEHKIYR